MARSRNRSGRRERRHLMHELARRFGDHELPMYAAAIAFRAIVALIPLILLGLGLLGALGLQDTWHNSIAPAIKPHVTAPVFHAIDFSAEKILSSGTAPLIVFAGALVVWDLAIAVLAVMNALNRVHDIEEHRSLRRRALLSLGLATCLGLCLVGAVLILIVAPRAGGELHVLLGIGRWVVALLLLGVAVGVLVRVAPAERVDARWASVGSLLVVAVWLAASFLFRFWMTSVANFKSATGTLTGLLFLTGYVFVSSAIFLVGAEVDELLRHETDGRGFALGDVLAAALRR